MIPSFDIAPIDLHPKAEHTGATRKLFTLLPDNDVALSIDWSTLSSFLECDKRFLWTAIHSRTSHKTSALTYGQAIHHALELWYCGNRDVDQIISQCESHFLDNPTSQGEWRNFDTFSNTIRQYVREYQHETFEPVRLPPSGDKICTNLPDDPTTPLVECPFRCPLETISLNATLPFPPSLLCSGEVHAVDPSATSFRVRNVFVYWTGVIDIVANNHDGRRIIVDHKTSSVVGPTYFDGYINSQQFIGYQWAANQLSDQKIEGALLNVIAGRRPSKTGKSLEFFRRYYWYRDDQVSEWPKSIIALVSQMLHNLTTSFFPMRTTACIGKYGQCPYLDVCTAEEEDRLNVLNTDQFATNVWNPLHN